MHRYRQCIRFKRVHGRKVCADYKTHKGHRRK